MLDLAPRAPAVHVRHRRSTVPVVSSARFLHGLPSAPPNQPVLQFPRRDALARRILVSRVKAVLRRSSDEPDTSTGTLQLGDVRLDPHEVRVFASKTELELTATEFRLLQVLMTKPGRVYTRDELMTRGYEGTHFV